MKSNVCKIEKGTRDLGAILKESERVAVYNELTHKQTLQLRLLCEEIDGMLPNIIDVFDGEFWIDFENHVCKVNVLLKIPEFNIYQKEELIGIAKNKKNSAAVGIVGKIRDSVENFLLDEMRMEALTVSSESLTTVEKKTLTLMKLSASSINSTKPDHISMVERLFDFKRGNPLWKN
jgi:hypothetical protein